MAKRRKVGNLLGLAVLSTVIERPMHPYEIASTLRGRGKEDDMDIKIGSLYTVVRNLETAGFIQAGDTSRAGARPERTVYRITGAGVAEMVDWVRELVSEPQPEHPKFKAGLSVAAVLGPEELAALLRRRLTALEQGSAARRREACEYAGQVPRLFLLEGEFELAMRDAEAEWVRALLGELESGAFPDLEMWRANLAELSARHGAPHEHEGERS
jgi:DNA-binding PadR family transcriptional regulator